MAWAGTRGVKVSPGSRKMGSTFTMGSGARFRVTGFANLENSTSFGHFDGMVGKHLSSPTSYTSGSASTYSGSDSANFPSMPGGPPIPTPLSFPTPPTEFSSNYMAAIDPNEQGRANTEESDECEEDAESENAENEDCDDRMGKEKILREFDYIRAKVEGKGLVMGVATPPPGQVVIVKLNAGHIFKNFASKDLALLGHVYQFGHLPDIPTI